MKQVPKRLQAVLWSADVRLLNINRDKGYIIHQVLSYGRLEDIRWLFKMYGKETIRDVFISIPYKDYTVSRFYFVKKYLLDFSTASFDERDYVKNTPRRLE